MASTVAFSPYHLYGFMSKCAEYGIGYDIAVEMYKSAGRPVVSTSGEYLGEENAQARSDLVDERASEAREKGLPLYTPARPIERPPVEDDVEQVEAPVMTAPAQTRAIEKPVVGKKRVVEMPPLPPPEHPMKDYNPRGGHATGFFTPYRSSGHYETGEAKHTTSLVTPSTRVPISVR